MEILIILCLVLIAVLSLFGLNFMIIRELKSNARMKTYLKTKE